jgi:hypothetical protein
LAGNSRRQGLGNRQGIGQTLADLEALGSWVLGSCLGSRVLGLDSLVSLKPL